MPVIVDPGAPRGRPEAAGSAPASGFVLRREQWGHGAFEPAPCLRTPRLLPRGGPGALGRVHRVGPGPADLLAVSAALLRRPGIHRWCGRPPLPGRRRSRLRAPGERQLAGVPLEHPGERSAVRLRYETDLALAVTRLRRATDILEQAGMDDS